jgi:hypothetical protein
MNWKINRNRKARLRKLQVRARRFFRALVFYSGCKIGIVAGSLCAFANASLMPLLLRIVKGVS